MVFREYLIIFPPSLGSPGNVFNVRNLNKCIESVMRENREKKKNCAKQSYDIKIYMVRQYVYVYEVATIITKNIQS